jgi:hypothetical protein
VAAKDWLFVKEGGVRKNRNGVKGQVDQALVKAVPKFALVNIMCWPKEHTPSILDGTRKPPAITAVK